MLPYGQFLPGPQPLATTDVFPIATALNGSTWLVAVGGWLLSLSMMPLRYQRVVVCISISFHFTAEQDPLVGREVPQVIYPSAEKHLSCFQKSSNYEESCYKHFLCWFLCESKFPFL